MWQNFVERGKPQMTLWRMRVACLIHKATNTHSQYVILIAFPLQQWLHQHSSMLSILPVLCVIYVKLVFQGVKLGPQGNII